jgi:hypothetical protein
MLPFGFPIAERCSACTLVELTHPDHGCVLPAWFLVVVTAMRCSGDGDAPNLV